MTTLPTNPIGLFFQRSGIPQKEIARRCGLSAPTVSKLVNRRTLPRPQMLKTIAEAFGVSVDELLGRQPGPSSHPASLQEGEKRILLHLHDAWQEFLSLRDEHPEATDEFRRSLHVLQTIIGTRVARRLDPGFWR